MTKNVFLLFVLVIVCGCHKKSGIKKVEFAKSFCFGSCVAAAIKIDSAGNYKLFTDSSQDWNFKGKQPATRSYVGKISNDYWNQLTDLLEDAEYKSSDTTKKIEIADTQHYEVFIYDGSAKIKLSKINKVEYAIYKFIDSSAHLVKLRRIPDTLNFGTTMQINPQLLP
ncbi:hypothetical protein MUGA111182_05600 [Mucilaginibacter galii]|uniref:Lipoprotein n=1 Tax=Mucilaginibacter galii TaxID=2005073 RepID=A0A917J8M4_9SPHI|nr:hypothetical protein [Mucilaginibacter galii]GGI49937.1 hypothetical protein GCM10011425_11490 [Mucilaginibacter galii]